MADPGSILFATRVLRCDGLTCVGKLQDGVRSQVLADLLLCVRPGVPESPYLGAVLFDAKSSPPPSRISYSASRGFADWTARSDSRLVAIVDLADGRGSGLLVD